MTSKLLLFIYSLFGYLVAKEDPPLSLLAFCRTLISVKHILLECRQFNEIRIKQKLPDILYRILAHTHETFRKLMNFIDETKLRHSIILHLEDVNKFNKNKNLLNNSM